MHRSAHLRRMATQPSVQLPQISSQPFAVSMHPTVVKQGREEEEEEEEEEKQEKKKKKKKNKKKKTCAMALAKLVLLRWHLWRRYASEAAFEDQCITHSPVPQAVIGCLDLCISCVLLSWYSSFCLQE